MAKKQGLGSHLDSSIFDFDNDIFGSDAGSLATLNLSDIEPNRAQPRKQFDTEKLNALASSIAEHGVIQPLIVRELEIGTYQLVAGERRWRAAKIAGLTEVPVRIMALSDEQTMQIALIENLQREDLNPVEEALAYKELMETYGMKQEEVAKKVGRARSSIANSLRILQLPEPIRELVSEKKVSAGHCKALMGIEDEVLMLQLARKVEKEGTSVRALEKLVQRINTEQDPKREPKLREVFLIEAEASLKQTLGMDVRINKTKDKYTMSIDCRDEEQLRDLVNSIADFNLK